MANCMLGGPLNAIQAQRTFSELWRCNAAAVHIQSMAGEAGGGEVPRTSVAGWNDLIAQGPAALCAGAAECGLRALKHHGIS